MPFQINQYARARYLDDEKDCVKFQKCKRAKRSKKTFYMIG